VLIKNVRKQDSSHNDVYATLVGLGQLLQTFTGGRPNARIQFDYTKGFNNGSADQASLYLVADSQNRAGIAADSEIRLPSTILGSSIVEGCMDHSPSSKKFKGALEKLFERHMQEKQEEEPQKDDAAEVKKKEAEDKMKAAENKKNAAEDKKKAERDEAKKKPENEDRKRDLDAPEEDNQKHRLLQKSILCEHPEPPIKIILEQAQVTPQFQAKGTLTLINKNDHANKKINKDFVFKSWSDELVLDLVSKIQGLNEFEVMKFDLQPGTLVFVADAQQLMPLKKAIKDNFANATKLKGYANFNAGNFPSKLVQQKSFGALLPEDLLAISCMSLKDIALAWMVALHEDGKTIVPTGLALVNSKQCILEKGASKIVGETPLA
jgi:hypothetical protein